MFRELKSVPLSYKRQGYIFFLCQNYAYLENRVQNRISQLCLEITGEYYQALFKFLTSDPDEIPAWRIAQDYYIPVNRLYKLRKQFFIEYDKRYKYENRIAEKIDKRDFL